jgi:hypothetical protein
MNRNALGIIAAILLFLGGVTVLFGPGGGNASGFAGGCIRVGLVLGALWLALPQIFSTFARLPRWAISWFIKKEEGPGEGSPTAPRPVRKQPSPRRRSNS